jgi:opacity protein-like surface antigen
MILKPHWSLIALTIVPLASGQAQEPADKGFYVVARAGATVNPEVKFASNVRGNILGNIPGVNFTAGDLTSDGTVKFKTAPFGEIGAGYRFGNFRLEQTLGYSSSDAKDSATNGDVSLYTLTISGFVDIPVSDTIVPYVGGGVGAVRADSTLSRDNVIGGTDVTVEDKAWGPFWHVDVGVGFRVAPRVTVALGARYAKSFGDMKSIGDSESDGLVAATEVDSLSGTLGLRYSF